MTPLHADCTARGTVTVPLACFYRMPLLSQPGEGEAGALYMCHAEFFG